MVDKTLKWKEVSTKKGNFKLSNKVGDLKVSRWLWGKFLTFVKVWIELT